MRAPMQAKRHEQTRALQLVALAQDVKGKCVEGRLDGSVNHHPSAGSARKRHAAEGKRVRADWHSMHALLVLAGWRL